MNSFSLTMGESIESSVLEVINSIELALSEEDAELSALKGQLTNALDELQNLRRGYQDLNMRYVELKKQLSETVAESELNLLQLHELNF